MRITNNLRSIEGRMIEEVMVQGLGDGSERLVIYLSGDVKLDLRGDNLFFGVDEPEPYIHVKRESK